MFLTILIAFVLSAYFQILKTSEIIDIFGKSKRAIEMKARKAYEKRIVDYMVSKSCFSAIILKRCMDMRFGK